MWCYNDEYLADQATVLNGSSDIVGTNQDYSHSQQNTLTLHRDGGSIMTVTISQRSSRALALQTGSTTVIMTGTNTKVLCMRWTRGHGDNVKAVKISNSNVTVRNKKIVLNVGTSRH